MKQLSIASAFFLAFALPGWCQQNNHWLKTKIKSADSVILVSHELTDGIGLIDDKTGKRIPLPKLVIAGKPNYKIVKQKQVLVSEQLDTLIKILDRPFEDSEIVQGKCFLPHQALFLIKNGVTSYINICFHCLGFVTSKDLEKIYYFDSRKWKELEAFFLKMGLDYQPN